MTGEIPGERMLAKGFQPRPRDRFRMRPYAERNITHRRGRPRGEREESEPWAPSELAWQEQHLAGEQRKNAPNKLGG